MGADDRHQRSRPPALRARRVAAPARGRRARATQSGGSGNVSSVAGRKVNSGSGVYNLTKHGVGAFSESLRQEITRQYVRVGLVEPGAVATELVGHNRPEVVEALTSRPGLGSPMQAGDVADAILYMVTRPRHVAINEILIRPTDQER
ncbi:MAG: SDR family oxidoreductase [Solirubrobacteraceae bacterium]